MRHAAESITPDARAGDLWQAMMDLGQAICTARAPKCLLCPLAQDCDGRVTGAPETFPVKPPKPARPQRYGTIFRSEEHTSELQSLMSISYAVFCLKKKKKQITTKSRQHTTSTQIHNNTRHK